MATYEYNDKLKFVFPSGFMLDRSAGSFESSSGFESRAETMSPVGFCAGGGEDEL